MKVKELLESGTSGEITDLNSFILSRESIKTKPVFKIGEHLYKLGKNVPPENLTTGMVVLSILDTKLSGHHERYWASQSLYPGSALDALIVVGVTHNPDDIMPEAKTLTRLKNRTGVQYLLAKNISNRKKIEVYAMINSAWLRQNWAQALVNTGYGGPYNNGPFLGFRELLKIE